MRWALVLLAACGRVDFATLSGAADARVDASPDATDPSTILPPNVVLAVEAETGVLVAPFELDSDPLASGGRYLLDQFFEGGHQSGGSASYTFDLPASGSYVIWVRGKSTDTAADSFFLAIDGGSPVEVDTDPPGMPDPDWIWVAATTNVTPFPLQQFTLAAGAHTFVFSSRETLSQLDRFAVALP
jgi:hypothetical protein